MNKFLFLGKYSHFFVALSSFPKFSSIIYFFTTLFLCVQYIIYIVIPLKLISLYINSNCQFQSEWRLIKYFVIRSLFNFD